MGAIPACIPLKMVLLHYRVWLIVMQRNQKEEAGRLAWNAPGVWTVDNELLVIYN